MQWAFVVKVDTVKFVNFFVFDPRLDIFNVFSPVADISVGAL